MILQLSECLINQEMILNLMPKKITNFLTQASILILVEIKTVSYFYNNSKNNNLDIRKNVFSKGTERLNIFENNNEKGH